MQKPEAKNWLRDGLAQEGQAVGRILQMGKEHGFSVLLVIYPYPVMMAHSWLDNEHTKFWKEFASKNSVALVDLSSEFVEKRAKPEETYKKYFIPGDFHWNNEGNNLVAKALVSRIMEKITSP